MGAHIVNGLFQSDKYPTCPPGKVPLSVKDPTAQDLLWEYAQRRRAVDAEFSDDLELVLRAAGYGGTAPVPEEREVEAASIALGVGHASLGFGCAFWRSIARTVLSAARRSDVPVSIAQLGEAAQEAYFIAVELHRGPDTAPIWQTVARAVLDRVGSDVRPALTSSEDEQAQAKRWARTIARNGTTPAEFEALTAVMLPLVREARASAPHTTLAPLTAAQLQAFAAALPEIAGLCDTPEGKWRALTQIIERANASRAPKGVGDKSQPPIGTPEQETKSGCRVRTDRGDGRVLHRGATVGYWWIGLDSGAETCLPSAEFQVLP